MNPFVNGHLFSPNHYGLLGALKRMDQFVKGSPSLDLETTSSLVKPFVNGHLYSPDTVGYLINYNRAVGRSFSVWVHR